MRVVGFNLWVSLVFVLCTVGLRAEEVPAIVYVRSYDSAAEGAEAADEKLGFVVESEGMILTTYEVLRDAKTKVLRPVVRVEMVDGGRVFSAAIVGVEPTLNFAILKVESEDPMPVSKLCPRERILVGQRVRALAGVEDGEVSYVEGLISDLNSMECYQQSMTATMLRAKIEIPEGSVGGPVFNDAGEVVAIFTGHEPVDGVGDEHEEAEESNLGKVHILPIFLVSTIYESLKLKKTLKSPWTGFSVRPLTEEEKDFFPLERLKSGVGIESVWKGGPAEKLGIRVGDILLKFSYYRTGTVAEFQKWLYAHGVGFEVKLYLLRDGEEMVVVPYLIEERPGWAVPK